MDTVDTSQSDPNTEGQPISRYEYNATTKELTGIPIVSMRDTKSGITLHTAVANSDIQFPSVVAYAGARYSRSADSVTTIMAEIQRAYMEKGISAQEKLANIFKGYGHPSVGDMAQMMLYIENLPFISAANIFYQSAVQSGQERSTRYQDFSNVRLPDLSIFANKDSAEISTEVSQRYEGLKDFSLEMYHKYMNLLTEEYRLYFKPANKQEEKSLTSRVFDSTRYWLLSGFPTSAAYITSAREWSRMIGLLKGADSEIDQSLGQQLEHFLTPDEEITKQYGYMGDAPDLIRHTDPNSTVINNEHLLQNLLQLLSIDDVDRIDVSNRYEIQGVSLVPGKYTSGELLVAKYVLSIFPDLKVLSLLDYLKKLPNSSKRDISSIVFGLQDRHNCLTEMGREGGLTMFSRISIGEMRDMNRHRAMGKFSTILSTINPQALMSSNFTLPLYLEEIDEFWPIKEEFIHDMNTYFMRLTDFYNQIRDWDNFEIIRYLLPLASVDTFFLSGGPREVLYTADTRVRPGGHINYRDLAYRMAELASKDLYLASVLKGIKKPNSSSREEFFDRS